MSPRLHLLFSAALPLAVAVACTKPSEQSVRLSPSQPASNLAPVAPIAPSAALAKPAPAPSGAVNATTGKERRPVQPWARYWLTE